LLGFEVTSELQNQQLAYYLGKIASLPYLKRSPTDSITPKTIPHEAGIQSKRSFFGWSDPFISSKAQNSEGYHVSLPLLHLPSWSTQFQTLSQWYKNRKMLVINPTNAIFVIATVNDLYYHPSNTFQFGGSPLLIRQGGFWSPQNLGRALVLFVTENKAELQPGVIQV